MAKFVKQNAQRPHIDFLVVTRFLQHFWRHVSLRAAVSLPLSTVKVGTCPEVTELHVAFCVQQKIFQFHVSMAQAVLMQKLKPSQHIGEIPERQLLSEALFVLFELAE
jgi:hypothetical protein